ncbi:MAG: threonine synthase [Candidatus Diapherotrites archaeon]|nr:threonine synthase [Candidatus Diapherotrites archaeon]
MVFASHLECFSCKGKFPADKIAFWCEKCGGSLVVRYKHGAIRKQILKPEFLRDTPSHWKYWMFYPINDLSRIISLNEGGTPLLPARKEGYFFKFEGLNPTGSFKDRGSTVEVSKARDFGITETICASTGNMGASVSAYGARGGLGVKIYVPGFAPPEKLAQIKTYGAGVVKVKGTYNDALLKTQDLFTKKKTYLTGDYAYRAEGQKSVALEIVDQSGWKPPDYLVAPIGMGTLFYALYKGLNEAMDSGLLRKLPKLVAVQSSGCSPVIDAFNNDAEILPVKKPKTVATAINCGSPNFGKQSLHALRKSNGLAVSVTDKEILQARKELGSEGVYAEPAGAVSYAGAKKLKLDGKVVCIVTGHGLKVDLF